MSESNNTSCFGGCTFMIIKIIILCYLIGMLFAYCSREDENKTFIQTTADYFEGDIKYIDSIINH